MVTLRKVVLLVIFIAILAGAGYFFLNRYAPGPQEFTSTTGPSVKITSESPSKSISFTNDGQYYLDKFLEDQGFWEEGAMDSPVYYAQSGKFKIADLQIRFVETPQTSLKFQGIKDLGSVGIKVDPITAVATVDVYVTDYLKNEVEEPTRSSLISSMTLQGIYRIIHPIVGDTKRTEGFDFDKFIQEFQDNSMSILQIKDKLGISFVKEVYADRCGVYRYDLGGQQNRQICSGGANNGAACNGPLQCPGGSCNWRQVCEINNPGGGECVEVPFAGGGYGCAPGNLGNCDNGTCPSGPFGTGGGGPTGPVCGNGICEISASETNATCPADCTSTGGSSGGGGGGAVTCSGTCFGGLSNCGQVGRVGVGGSCNNGELCCGFAGGGGFTGCRIWDAAPITIQVGESRNVAVSGFLYGDTLTAYNGALSNSAALFASPLVSNLCCSSNYGDYTYNINVTGLTVGSSWLTSQWTTNNGSVNSTCTNGLLINVVPNNSIPTITLTANGVSGTTSVSSGSNVTIGWASTNVTSCTASGAWTGFRTNNGTEIQNNVTTNRTYTLTCTGPNGTVEASVNVNVIGLPTLPTINMTVNGSPGGVVYVPVSTYPVWPYTINTNFRWNTVNATSCIGSTTPGSWSVYPYPGAWPYTPQPGWFLWDWTQPTSYNANAAGLTTIIPAFFTLTCSGPGGTSRRTVNVIPGTVPPPVLTPGACTIPTPIDPPSSICAPTPTTNGSITWRWAPVVGANQYNFVVEQGPGFAPVATTATGVRPAAFFNCNATECSHTTPLPPGQYRSSIIASSSTNACVASAAGKSAPFDLSTCPVAAWWQGGTGNVISKGIISSQVPYNTFNFILDGSSGRPGISSGTSVNTGTGPVSSTGWLTNSTYSGTIPSYADFYAQIPTGTVVSDPGANIGANTLTSGGTADAAGYVWYRHVGDITISANITFPANRKVILFVDGGDVTINGTIQFVNRENSYFMLIVGRTSSGTKGSIIIAPTVTAPTGTPALEGIFTSHTMQTGLGSVPLLIRGSVVVNGGVTLQRDLVAGNNAGPAETFVQSPELILNYPPSLTFKRLSWQEVAP